MDEPQINEQTEKRTLKIKKVVICAIIFLFLIGIIVLISLYISEREVREWIDINLLQKTMSEEEAITIDLNADKNNQVYAYSKYITVLNDKKLSIYNNVRRECKRYRNRNKYSVI